MREEVQNSRSRLDTALKYTKEGFNCVILKPYTWRSNGGREMEMQIVAEQNVKNV